MRSVSTLSPARVSAPQPCRETVLDQTRAGRGRVLQHITGFNRPNALNPVRTPSAVSHALTPLGGGLLARALSTTNLARLGPFLQRGQRWILNFCRRLAGSSFRTLLQSFQESSRVAIVLLSPLHFADLFGLVAVFHGQEPSERKLKCPTSVLKGKSR